MMTWELMTAARTLAQEARNQPLEGQQAVAWTFRNRMMDGRWGKSIASVCLWRAAYSGWYSPRTVNGKSYQDPNFAYVCGLADDDQVLLKMLDVLNGVLAADLAADITRGATHYYAISIAAPYWVEGAVECGQFGDQKFFRGVK